MIETAHDGSVGAGGVLRLPAALRRHLVLLVAAKFMMLAVLYALFFSPGHRPPIDVAAHIVGVPGKP
jgi:hypothetical protein